MNLAPRFTQDAPTYGGGVGEGSHVRVHKPLHYSGVSGLARPSHGSQHPQLSRASPEEGKKGKATNRGVWGASSHQGRAAHILTNLKTQTTSKSLILNYSIAEDLSKIIKLLKNN